MGGVGRLNSEPCQLCRTFLGSELDLMNGFRTKMLKNFDQIEMPRDRVEDEQTSRQQIDKNPSRQAADPLRMICPPTPTTNNQGASQPPCVAFGGHHDQNFCSSAVARCAIGALYLQSARCHVGGTREPIRVVKVLVWALRRPLGRKEH